MDNKNKFNTVKIATCNDAHKAEAVNQLFERSLLFNRSDDICGIVISKNDEKQFIPISAIPDNVNIEKRDGIVTLVENPVVDSITTKADHNGVDWKSQCKIAETSAERTIILLCTKNIENSTNIGVIGGEILEVGEGIYGHYQVSLTPTGSGLFKGATTFEQKATLVRAKYNGTYYYGIKFKSTVPANIYFSGWDHFPEGADAPLYTSYTDADLSEIIELGGGDSGDSSGGGMTEAEKAEINGKIDALQGQVDALSGTVGSCPVGTIMCGLYSSAPTGFLLCNGQEVSISDYQGLYSEIGSLDCCKSSNAGMFKLPNLQDRVLQGANKNLGTMKEAGLPNITADMNSMMTDAGGSFSGAIYVKNIPRVRGWSGMDANEIRSLRFDASRSSSIYGRSSTVQPPAVCVNYIIKY